MDKTKYAPFEVAGLASLALAGAALLLFVPPLHQDESYHAFSDARTILGIPNFWNVISNLPFAALGILGLWKLRGVTARILSCGLLLTCLGSSYYHLAPNDARLLWDRLPMTIVFMSFLYWVMAETQGTSDIRLLWLLLGCGIASVVWWRMTSDLRPYALVQFGPVVVFLMALPYTRNQEYLWAVLGLYALAKCAEQFDPAIYSILPISGHTCKHLLAGFGSYWIYRWGFLPTADRP
jgi:hypothetical protein